MNCLLAQSNLKCIYHIHKHYGNDYVLTAGHCQSGDLGTLVELGHDQCRLSEGAASITNGVVCYTGTATGSLAYYICDDGYELNDLREGVMNPRECNQDGQWSGTEPECTSREGELMWYSTRNVHVQAANYLCALLVVNMGVFTSTNMSLSNCHL